MDTICDKPQPENEYGALKFKNLLPPTVIPRREFLEPINQDHYLCFPL